MFGAFLTKYNWGKMFEATVNVICQAPNKTKGFIIQQGKPQSMTRGVKECARLRGGGDLATSPFTRRTAGGHRACKSNGQRQEGSTVFRVHRVLVKREKADTGVELPAHGLLGFALAG